MSSTAANHQVQENLSDELPAGVAVCTIDIGRSAFILVPGGWERVGNTSNHIHLVDLSVDTYNQR